LKDDAVEFTDEDKIRNLVKKYSEFINYPISLYTSRQEEVEVPIEQVEDESEVVIHKTETEDDVDIVTEEE
jgi:heat shock protein beta